MSGSEDEGTDEEDEPIGNFRSSTHADLSTLVIVSPIGTNKVH